RTVLLVVLALATFSPTPTGADAGAWCATYRWGTTNCGYSSSDQCWASVRGMGGLPTESISRDGLRDVLRRLECTQFAKALSAHLLANRNTRRRAHRSASRILAKWPFEWIPVSPV